MFVALQSVWLLNSKTFVAFIFLWLLNVCGSKIVLPLNQCGSKIFVSLKSLWLLDIFVVKVFVL